MLLVGALVGCGRSCSHSPADDGDWKGRLRPLPLNAADCPDGLAKCEQGVVYASRLATIPQPCGTPAAPCACPWDRLAECPHGCVADGVELVVEREPAKAQLCAPTRDNGPLVRPPPPGAAPPPCEEGERYRCATGLVVECVSGLAVGQCLRGCFAEGAAVDDDGVSREAAFAMLCSR